MRPLTAGLGQPPVVHSGLVADLRQLGVATGDVLLAHTSLRALGQWVCGGAATVVSALLEAIGPSGTLVVPAQSPECQDPARWRHRPVPAQWLPRLRAELPPFDPGRTPSATGAVSESVRTMPGAVRSIHPLTSFAGIGPAAAHILSEHQLPSLLGEASPLAKLETAGARILLLGVGYKKCTAMHLAEYRLPNPMLRKASCIMQKSTRDREWVSFDTIELDATDFPLIGKDLEESVGWVRIGHVAGATARLLPLHETVQYAHKWLQQHRRAAPHSPSEKSAPILEPVTAAGTGLHRESVDRSMTSVREGHE